MNRPGKIVRIASALLPFERAAIVFLICAFGLALFWSQLYTALWVGLILLYIPVWFVGVVLAVGGLMLAFTDGEPMPLRLRSALAMPLAVAFAWLLHGPATWLGYQAHGSWMLYRDGDEMAARIAQQDGKATAFPMMAGIPDGGVSLVYAPRQSPATATQSEMLRLVGERIHACAAVRTSWYVCSFD